MNPLLLVAILLTLSFAPRPSQASCVLPFHERKTILDSIPPMKERHADIPWESLDLAEQSELAFTLQRLGETRSAEDFKTAYASLRAQEIRPDFLIDAYLSLASGDVKDAVRMAEMAEPYLPGLIKRLRKGLR